MFSLKKPRSEFWLFFFGAIATVLVAYVAIKYLPWWLNMLLLLGGFTGFLIWNWKRFANSQRLICLIMIVSYIALFLDRWIKN